VVLATVSAVLAWDLKQARDEIRDLRFPPEGLLEGEIFIVTKGGGNFKLGLVTVGLFRKDELASKLEAARARAAPEIERLSPLLERAKGDYEAANRLYTEAIHNNEMPMAAFRKVSGALSDARHDYQALVREAAYFASGDYFFQELPTAMVAAKTNSDGRFSMKIPTTEPFALGAQAQRSVGDRTEKYFWLVEVSMEGKSKDTILLSNDNLTSTAAPTSLLRTLDEPE